MSVINAAVTAGYAFDSGLNRAEDVAPKKIEPER
jgi:hypothetical protein